LLLAGAVVAAVVVAVLVVFAPARYQLRGAVILL
jgi:hypothetical protein